MVTVMARRASYVDSLESRRDLCYLRRNTTARWTGQGPIHVNDSCARARFQKKRICASLQSSCQADEIAWPVMARRATLILLITSGLLPVAKRHDCKVDGLRSHRRKRFHVCVLASKRPKLVEKAF